VRRFNLKILLLLSSGHLITDIYQGSLPAILPLLKDRLDLSYTLAGVIIMTSSLTSSVIQPLFGLLSDRTKKTYFLPLGCLCAGIGFSLLSLPSDFGSLLLLVTLSGLGVASYHPEGYKTAHFFTGSRLATGMSIFSVGGNLGFALGPVISLSLIGTLGFSSLPLMVVFSLFFVVLLFFFREELAVLPQDEEKGVTSASEAGRGAYVSLVMLIGTVIMRSWTQMGLMTYIPFYFVNYLRGDPLYAGKLVSAFLMGGAVGTLLGAPLADRWGHKPYLVSSLLLTSLLLPLVLAVQGEMLFVVLATLGMILISSFTVTIVMAQRLLPGKLGIASGLMVGLAIGTGGIGTTILGVIADAQGVPAAMKSMVILPVAGLLLSIVLRYPPTQDRRSPT
jgi:FSR family fosmidomycin resistance protein-like MFS transporter